jgi:hypothetical protein
VTWPIQDHTAAVMALLAADSQLTTYDGAVPKTPAAQYALVYFYIETPDGQTAPDKISLTYASNAINVRAYVHCVGSTPSAARAIAGRVRQALLDVTPTVAGRSCWPIRWIEGQPPQRDEETLQSVFDLVDVYGFSSVPSS